MRNKIIAGLTLVGIALGFVAVPASAEHTHALVLPNGKCTILAENGNEKYTGPHPLHNHLHLNDKRNGKPMVVVVGSPAYLEYC